MPRFASSYAVTQAADKLGVQVRNPFYLRYPPPAVDDFFPTTYTENMTKITNEELARMIAKGFEQTASKADLENVEERLGDRITGLNGRLSRVESRLDHMDDRLGHMDARMVRMEQDIAEIRGNIIYRYEIDDALARIKYIETKLGIESGK